MKRNLLLIGCIGLLMASCGSSNEIIESIKDEVSDELNLPDRIASGRATGYARSMDRGDSTLSQIDYQYYTPQFSSGVMDSTYKDSVNDRIVHWASIHALESEIRPLGPLTDYYFERVLDDFTTDEEDDSTGFNAYQWSLEMVFSIEETSEYAMLNTSYWGYMGGAHGDAAIFYEFFDKATGNIVGLDYFFTDIEELTRIAEPFFREQEKLEEGLSYVDAGYWFEDDAFHVSQHFYFSGDKIVFAYNPYEIAPYAAGPIEFSVPLSELSAVAK